MIYQREIPFVKVVIPLMIGITFGYHFQFSLSILLPFLVINFIVIAIVAIVKVSPSYRKILSFVYYLFFLLFGISSITFSAEQTKLDERIIDKKKSFKVKIIESPKIGNRISFRGEIIDVDTTLSNQNSSLGELYVSIGKKEEIIDLHKGDELYVYGAIKPLSNTKNKYTFDFKNHLKTKGIKYQIFVKEKDWKLIKLNDAFSLINSAKKIQNKFAKIIQKYIPSSSESTIVQALVVGSKSNLDPSIRDAYASTGSLHVLAVSGLHVGLIYAFLIFLFKFSNEKSKFLKWSKFWIALMVIWSFTFISGAAPSVIRASTMLSLLLIAKNIQRYPNTYNVIAFTAFCMLVYNPWQLFDVSFQLSFLALLGIVFFHSRIYRSWYIKNWLGDKIWTLTALGISAQLGTFPIAIFYFHQFPMFFWLTGIFVVPFASLILGLGLVLLASHFVLPFLAPLVGKLLQSIVWLLNAMIYLVQEIPGSTFKGIWIGESFVILLYATIFLLALAIGFRNKKILWSSSLILIGLLGFSALNKLLDPEINQLHIYHSYNNSRIDYLRNKTAYQFQSEDFNEKQIRNIVTPLHEFLGIKKEQLTLPNRISNDYYDGIDYYSFNNLKVGILKASPKFRLAKPIDLDLLIFTGNPKLKIATLASIVNPKRLIIDGSIPFWTVNNWKNDLQNFYPKSKLYLTSEVGAITINFETGFIQTVTGTNEKF